MGIFWFEFLFFATAIFGILVAYSSFSLFFRAYRVERQLLTMSRAVGFLLLVIAFILFIVERKYGFLGPAGVSLEMLGFFMIYRGVKASPRLSQLTRSKDAQGKEIGPWWTYVPSFPWRPVLRVIGAVLAVFLAALALWLVMNEFEQPLAASAVLALQVLGGFVSRWVLPFLLTAAELVSLIFILLTIRLQVIRFRGESGDRATRLNNLWPLIAYVFFAFRATALAAYRVPELDLVVTRLLNAEYGMPWVIAAAGTFLGFFFLAIWVWRFIRVRFFLRTYVVFLALTTAVATAGVLIFSLLIFQIVEKNNLALMALGAKTESLIMTERRGMAEMLSRLLAEESLTQSGVGRFDVGLADERARFFREHTNVDSIRFFSPQREVLSSPTDARDVGRVFADDELLLDVIESQRSRISFSISPGVLSNVLTGRALHVVMTQPDMIDEASVSASDRTAETEPVVSGEPPEARVAGVVEVGYVFDNAFVDYSKRETGLEVTFYTGSERSATTIFTEDGTSRWVGSAETNTDVVQKVLKEGQDYQTSLDRLGVPYYSAFIPVRNADEKIVGMVSVGVPTQILLEDSRQRLLTSFFAATLISLLAAIVGYFAFRNFDQKR